VLSELDGGSFTAGDGCTMADDFTSTDIIYNFCAHTRINYAGSRSRGCQYNEISPLAQVYLRLEPHLSDIDDMFY
jgi:hypothetical protein